MPFCQIVRSCLRDEKGAVQDCHSLRVCGGEIVPSFNSSTYDRDSCHCNQCGAMYFFNLSDQLGTEVAPAATIEQS